MDKPKNNSSHLIIWIFIWFLLMGLALAGFGYWQMGIVSQSLQDQPSPEVLAPMLQNVGILSLQVLGGSLLLFGLLLWLTLRASVRRTLARMDDAKPAAPAPKKAKQSLPPRQTPEEKEALLRENQRRTVHLLSLLQREGRLVDFLTENLKDYDDAQIGAAVRSIQESCQKALKKYLKIEAVIDQEEGEEIVVEKGFDASRIKLTGNVTGEPPFKGSLQHRGWRVGKFDLPTLSGSPDPSVITPAEVEIP
jgi:hypothetical protein